MFKKLTLLFLLYLMQNPSYGMNEEEIFQNNSGINHPKDSIEIKNNSNEIEPKSKKSHLLFLCTGNSCRSQMAEGWARHLGSDLVEVNSAGINAHGLNPKAVQVMKELEVDITNQTSKTISSNMFEWADVVVTVCGHADENCPLLPKKVKKIHWPIEDPAKAIGDEEEVMKKFQIIRDEIREQVSKLLFNIKENIQIN